MTDAFLGKENEKYAPPVSSNHRQCNSFLKSNVSKYQIDCFAVLYFTPLLLNPAQRKSQIFKKLPLQEWPDPLYNRTVEY